MKRSIILLALAFGACSSTSPVAPTLDPPPAPAPGPVNVAILKPPAAEPEHARNFDASLVGNLGDVAITSNVSWDALLAVRWATAAKVVEVRSVSVPARATVLARPTGNGLSISCKLYSVTLEGQGWSAWRQADCAIWSR
jgi:hypothetical protein